MNKLLDALNYIHPQMCSYQEWVNIGMALKHEGYTANDWDNWSRDDNRYHPGECQRKWETFEGNSSPITGATIFKMAHENGYSERGESRELDWNDEISFEVEDFAQSFENNTEPPHIQLIKYLETLFEASENVGYVTESWERDGKFLPSKGHCDRTAGQLIEALSKCGGDIGAVLGDYKPEAGAWIRFNPLDGKGVKNENVTEYRYCLVESDNMDISEQRKIIENIKLPVACLVFSGKKSIHAITHVDASSKDEYRKRVEYIYKICQEAGLKVDIQNKNASRLSRMPGIKRGDKEQTLLSINMGFNDFLSWEEYIESINDDLPDEESLANIWNNLPELAPPLIDGVLRQGHKMLVAGPSKAGKSFALIELAIALAEGSSWMGFNCTKGKVLYVNLELDRASCFHRFKDVYNELKISPDSLNNIDIWNLRGKSCPMDKLAPKLIRRAKQKGYRAVIIDPIYKVITGDENSADQMAAFCNQFDKICTELGTAVIYCHHHSKGSQIGKKSMDRASGSGVFARDPDALLDIVEIELDDNITKKLENDAVCKRLISWLTRFGFADEITNDIKYDEVKLRDFASTKLKDNTFLLACKECEAERSKVSGYTAWQIDATLREFPKFAPLNVWFKYPIHTEDDQGLLSDVFKKQYEINFSKQKTPEQRKKEKLESFDIAFEACQVDGKASLKELADYSGVVVKTIRNRLKNSKKYWVDDSEVGKK